MDLTGEPLFIREAIDRFHEQAQASGARIVHCCGFDSIPSDLGTFVYTGGTTGPSKGCMLSHNYHEAACRQISTCWQRSADDVLRVQDAAIRNGLVTAVHDLSDGGLGVALAEMAVASGIGPFALATDGGGSIRRPASYGGLVGLTLWQFDRAPTGFIPQQDQGYLITVVQLPPGSSLARTDAVVRKAAKIILETEGVDHAVPFAGMVSPGHMRLEPVHSVELRPRGPRQDL